MMKLKLLGIVFLGCVFTGNLLSSDQFAQKQQCFDSYVTARNNLKKTIDAAYAKYQLVYSQSALNKASNTLEENFKKANNALLEALNTAKRQLKKKYYQKRQKTRYNFAKEEFEAQIQAVRLAQIRCEDLRFRTTDIPVWRTYGEHQEVTPQKVTPQNKS